MKVDQNGFTKEVRVTEHGLLSMMHSLLVPDCVVTYLPGVRAKSLHPLFVEEYSTSMGDVKWLAALYADQPRRHESEIWRCLVENPRLIFRRLDWQGMCNPETLEHFWETDATSGGICERNWICDSLVFTERIWPVWPVQI